MDSREYLAKAGVAFGVAANESAVIQYIDSRDQFWSDSSAITVDYDPEILLKIIEHTPHIQPNIDAYSNNICGLGYESTLVKNWLAKIDTDEGRDHVKSALEYENMQNSIDAGVEYDSEISDDEVDQKINEIKGKIKYEQFVFDSFFKNCCSDSSFTELMVNVCDDRESIGWGAIEKIRDENGTLVRLNHVPAHQIRPLIRNEMVETIEDNSATIFSVDREIKVNRYFKVFVQSVCGKCVFFKESGDPRVISRETGKSYKTEADLEAAEWEDDMPRPKPANEIIWFPLKSKRTVCPPPRWITNLPRVLGTREADETNYNYLKNKTISPGMLLVSGGNVSSDGRRRVQNLFRDQASGAENSGRMVILEATSAKNAPNERTTIPKIDFIPLKDSAQNDAMFTEYDQRNSESIGAAFRLSPILRGYIPSALNRATAYAALEFAESQVFSPIRRWFEDVINREICKDLGLKYIKLSLTSISITSPEDAIEFLKMMRQTSAFDVNDIRQYASKTSGQKFDERSEEWANKPFDIVINGVSDEMSDETIEMIKEKSELKRRVRLLEHSIGDLNE